MFTIVLNQITSSAAYFLRKARREWLFFLGLLIGSKTHVKLAIVTRSRSGSNMLCSFLESHPQAFVWREIFRRPQYFTPQLTYRLINSSYLGRYRVVAFKVFYYHRVPDLFWEQLVADERIHIIHLIRPNYLDTYVSRRQAMASQQWESFEREKIRPTESSAIQVDIADLMAFLEENEQLIASFVSKTQGRRNLLTLTFEQVARDEGRALIAEFLKSHLDPSGFGAIRNTKQGASNLEKRIINYEEVKQAILGSRWRHFLDNSAR